MHPAGLLGAEPSREGTLQKGGRNERVWAASTSPSNMGLIVLHVLENISIFQANVKPHDLGYTITKVTSSSPYYDLGSTQSIL